MLKGQCVFDSDRYLIRYELQEAKIAFFICVELFTREYQRPESGPVCRERKQTKTLQPE